MPMGRYSASSSVNSDLASAAAAGGASSRVSSSASSSRIGGASGNGEINSNTSTPTSAGASQAFGDSLGAGFSNLRLFTSSVVKSFSLSTGLFQAASEEDEDPSSTRPGSASASSTVLTTKTKIGTTPTTKNTITKSTPSTIKYTGPGSVLNPLIAGGGGHPGFAQKQQEMARSSSVVSLHLEFVFEILDLISCPLNMFAFTLLYMYIH